MNRQLYYAVLAVALLAVTNCVQTIVIIEQHRLIHRILESERPR